MKITYLFKYIIHSTKMKEYLYLYHILIRVQASESSVDKTPFFLVI